MVACVALLGLFPVAASEGSESYHVELQSGRRFTADVDARTDHEKLWLSFGEGRVRLTRPVDWNRVVRVSDETRAYTADEFLPVALDRAAARAEAEENQPVPVPSEVAPATYVATVEDTPIPSPRVAHINVDAYLANWDGDVEADGVMVYVTPVDRDGNYVAVNGTLVAELFGERPRTRPEGEKFPRLGRWSRTVTPDVFGPQGAVFKLSFQAVHPDFDLRLTPYGLLHARLNVPGSGTFETSVPMLRIRQYSAYRDALQMHRGKRYLPVERLGRQR